MTTPSSHSTSAVRIGLRAICRRVQRPWSSLTGAPYRETKGPIGAVVSGRRGLDAYYVDVDQFWSRWRQQRLRVLHPSRGAESTRAAGATPDLRSTAAAIAAYGWARTVRLLAPQHVDEVGKIAIVVKQLVVEHNMGESTNSSTCSSALISIDHFTWLR